MPQILKGHWTFKKLIMPSMLMETMGLKVQQLLRNCFKNSTFYLGYLCVMRGILLPLEKPSSEQQCSNTCKARTNWFFFPCCRVHEDWGTCGEQQWYLKTQCQPWPKRFSTLRHSSVLIINHPSALYMRKGSTPLMLH